MATMSKISVEGRSIYGRNANHIANYNQNPQFNIKNKREIFAKYKSKFLQALFLMFCLCGCLWHITSVCKVYFAYGTTVTVTFGQQKEMELPATSFCLWHPVAISKSKIE